MLVTLPLYILRELGKAVALSLFVFSFVMLAFVAGSVIRDGAGVFTVLAIMPKLFPLVSPMVLPLTIITSTLICYGRLSSSNEFTATMAAGVQPLWLAAPALLTAVLAATITVYLNADVLSAATNSIEKTLLSDRTAILRQKLAKSGSFTFQKASICRLPPDLQGRSGIDITFFREPNRKEREEKKQGRWNPEYPHPEIRILARDHSISLHERDTGALYVQADLKDFTRFDLSSRDMQMLSASAVTQTWDVQANTNFRISDQRISYWGIGKILRRRREIREQILALSQKLSSLPPEHTEAPELEKTIKRLNKSDKKQTAELHLKLALSFACIGFAFIGIPLGLRGRKDGATTGFVYGIAIALTFFVIVKTLQSQVRDDRLGVWTMWLPNVLMLALGVGLWGRSQRVD